ERNLRAEGGREPTSEDIADELEMTVDEVEQLRRASQTPLSLENPVGEDEESEFGHFIEDENAPLPDEAADLSFREEALTQCLESLSNRERRVLEMRFGLNGEPPRSLDEVVARSTSAASASARSKTSRSRTCGRMPREEA